MVLICLPQRTTPMDKVKEYEFARKILKREKSNPNAYTKNRQKAMLDRAYAIGGDKAAKEIAKEFWRK